MAIGVVGGPEGTQRGFGLFPETGAVILPRGAQLYR